MEQVSEGWSAGEIPLQGGKMVRLMERIPVQPPAMAGNSANTTAAATSAAKKVSKVLDPVAWRLDSQTGQLLTRQKAIVKKFKLPTNLGTARIQQLRPPQIADPKKPVRQAYGFAIVGDKIVVVKGA